MIFRKICQKGHQSGRLKPNDALIVFSPKSIA
nr:MAG TPA: hypothetical protein [Caudoviricetes sp.]